jgi:hypothetical protein
MRISQLLAAAAFAAFANASVASANSIVRYPGSALQPTPPFIRSMRPPPWPPAPRHTVTAADRARARAGGWQRLVNPPPFGMGSGAVLLMTDGTVMVQDTCTTEWFSLTPDQNGSYVNGTWAQKASLPSGYGPLDFASAVLADGKLIINGGEYNFCHVNDTNLGAIYDPIANTWTTVAPPSGWTKIGDAQSAVLANGTYMLGNCCSFVQALLDESTMTWTQSGPGNGKADPDSEEGWTLLRGGNVLTVDVLRQLNSEVYNPTTNLWSSAGNLPVNLVGNTAEMGPQTMRPNNSVFVAGATGHTAIYDASGGEWAQGPDFPIVGGQQLDSADGPSTLLSNGNVMLPASPGVDHAPAYFYLFNGKKFISIAAPPNAPNDPSYIFRLLLLPTGQVLETDESDDVQIYTSSAKPDEKIAPEITSVRKTLTHGSTYKISGRYFNGFSQANFYGDDNQQATNYPLVCIVNDATGHVFYARTHNHSYMGIAYHPIVSTMFDVPSNIETGPSKLMVVANAIQSKPVDITIN